MPSKPFLAKYESTCPVCKKPILQNQTAVFPERGSKYIIHEACYGKLPTPPVASSVGQGGPKPGSDGRGMVGGTVELDHIPAPVEAPLVFVGGYVPLDRADVMLRAFKEARQ